MKICLIIAAAIALLINATFFVSYFVFSSQIRQYTVGEISFEMLIISFKISAVVIGIIATGMMVTMFWFVSALVLRDADQLSYEMKQIAGGNVDVEIRESTYDIFRHMSGDLVAVQEAIRDSRQNSDKLVEEKTKLLTKKIADLEKLRDLTTDSLLLAKTMQQERDQLLIQIHQLQDKRKKT